MSRRRISDERETLKYCFEVKEIVLTPMKSELGSIVVSLFMNRERAMLYTVNHVSLLIVGASMTFYEPHI